MNFLIATVLGYFLGSIPFGLLITRAGGIDIRSIGSGNIGATNVLRTGNRWMALGTLLLDAGKGAAAVLIARYFLTAGAESPLAANFIVYGAGVGAFFGHVFPIWLGFKGGKGVATYIGVLLAWNWIVALIFCGVWLLIAVTRKFSSLAALTTTLLTPVALFLTGHHAAALLFLLLTVLAWIRHADNIRRLVAGTESRIGQKK